jgi:hypothetical protein
MNGTLQSGIKSEGRNGRGQISALVVAVMITLNFTIEKSSKLLYTALS